MHMTFLLTGIVAVTLMLTTPVCGKEEIERAHRDQAYAGKMIDAHSHPRKIRAAHFSDAHKANIERVIVMRTPNDYREPKRKDMLSAAAQFSNVAVLCSSDFVGHLFDGEIAQARRVVAQIEQMLEEKRCAGIGEIGLRHYDKRWRRGGGQHELSLALDHTLIDEVISIANSHAVPVVLHIEPVYTPKAIDDLKEIKAWYKRVCKKYPRVTLIAAHNGMMSPADLEQLLRYCPNLFADVKILHSEEAVEGFADLHGVNDLDYRFFEAWALLIEKYPDRFLLGTDWKDGRRRGDAGRSYLEHIQRIRQMIGSLSPAVQERFAYSNAKRIYQLR